MDDDFCLLTYHRTMKRLARIVTDIRSAWAIVAVVVVLTAVSLGLAGQLRQEDDVLSFLPQGNEDIATFQSINQEFGGLNAAIVGIETKDVFDPDFLSRLTQATDDLQALPDVEHVLSITNIQDFTPDPMGGVQAGMLVSKIPGTAEEQAALRAHVLSRDHIRGSLISDDGSAVMILAFTGFHSDPQQVAMDIRSFIEPAFPEDNLYWGGSPFISTYIFQTTQADLARLSPWAVAAILVIMVAAFRDLVGTALGLVSTGIGILISRACMVAMDVPLNIVLGSMPIILFAVGSAYGIHMLGRYYAHARVMSCEEAVSRTVIGTGPVVLTAGLTTAVGLLSFVAMDIEPLRIFGIFTAIGIVATVSLSLTFIPAVIRIVGIGGADSAKPFGIAALMWSTAWLSRHRRVVAWALVLIAVVGSVYAGKVESRMDQSAFYSPGSPPDQSDSFLRDNFGGSQFIQILVEGDLRDPVHLRRIRFLAERMESIEHVTRVQHVGQPIALLNEMMEGQHRIPDSRPKVESLFGFLTGNPAVRQLANEERTKALLHVQIATNKADEIDLILQEIESEIAVRDSVAFKVVSVDNPEAVSARWAEIVDRVAVRLMSAGLSVDKAELRTAVELPVAVQDLSPVRDALRAHLTSSEALVPVSVERAEQIADAVVALGAEPSVERVDASIASIMELPLSDTLVGDLSWSVGTPLDEAWADAQANSAVDSLMAHLGLDAKSTVRDDVRLMLMDRRVETVAVADASVPAPLRYTVSGLPVMHRGLSESVTANQFKSLGFAMGLVAIILSAAFRSIRTGLLASAPTGLALIIIYGSMAALDISLDIGTSMLASLIIGAGVDYAVHVLSAWYARDDEPLLMAELRAAARVGPAVWTNALMVSVGFFVLTLGEARPLKNVGGLTSAAMLVAALVTFLVIPSLAKRRHYAVDPEPEDPSDVYIPSSMARSLGDQI